MNIVLLNEDKRIREKMTADLNAGGHKTTLASSSDSFIAAVSEGDINVFVIDLKTWYRGSAIYNYFDIPPLRTIWEPAHIGEEIGAEPRMFPE